MPKNLSTLFYPKSVAVIGVSSNPAKVGSIVFKNIQNSGYKGKIFAINRSGGEIDVQEIFKDLASLPEVPDLAVIAIPSSGIIEILSQMGAKGIKNAVVFAAGFKESGADGTQLEKNLIETATKFEINLLGPNCLGFVNNLCPINATFGVPVKASGNLRFITQSGAIAAALFDWCESIGLGIGEFITLGNKAVINENDCLQYFLSKTDSVSSISSNINQVHPIGLYLESISNGPEFVKIAQEISKKDPIYIIKPGKTTASAHAMQSHTGSIAGEDSVLEAALFEAGIVRCDTLEDFFDLSKAFEWVKMPEGPNVTVISNAGGPAVISADAIMSAGLVLTEIDAVTKEKLSLVLPNAAGIGNPIDVLGDALADRFFQVAEIMLQNEQTDSLLILLTPQIMTEVSKTAEFLKTLKNKYEKPIFCAFMGGRLIADGEKILNQAQIPSYRFPERAIEAISFMWKCHKYRLNSEKRVFNVIAPVEMNTIEIKNIVDSAVKNNQKTLDNLNANELLTAVGIPVPFSQIVASAEDAPKFTQKHGWPVTLKLSAPGLLHKKAVGGIVLDIQNDTQFVAAWESLQKSIAALPQEIKDKVKIQVQKEVESGVEVIVGIKNDPTFGPVLLFGAGGSLAEIILDRNLHLLPLDKAQIEEMVGKSKIFSAIKNAPLEKLYDLIYRLTKLYEIVPDILEIEINPVIITPNAIWSVDCKVLLKQEVKAKTGPKFKTSKVTSAFAQASTYHYFDLEADEPLISKPGQYISIKVSSDRINSYSLACRKDPKHFSLFIDTRPGGPGSKYFENLKVGDEVSFLGPFGSFVQRTDDGAQNLLFLGTGSGSSPLKCIIEDALINQKCTLPMYLYIGVNTVADVFWTDYLNDLCSKFPNFHYEIAVWKPDSSWKGHAGFITDLIAKDFPDARSCSAYLCGAKPMIDAATALLLQNGCPKERIYMEKF